MGKGPKGKEEKEEGMLEVSVELASWLKGIDACGRLTKYIPDKKILKDKRLFIWYIWLNRCLRTCILQTKRLILTLLSESL